MTNTLCTKTPRGILNYESAIFAVLEVHSFLAVLGSPTSTSANANAGTGGTGGGIKRQRETDLEKQVAKLKAENARFKSDEPSPTKTEARSEKKKSDQPCFPFQFGQCHRGADCRFAHTKYETKSSFPRPCPPRVASVSNGGSVWPIPSNLSLKAPRCGWPVDACDATSDDAVEHVTAVTAVPP